MENHVLIIKYFEMKKKEKHKKLKYEYILLKLHFILMCLVIKIFSREKFIVA